MLALGLRVTVASSVSACWCALLLDRKVLSIPRGYPLPLGRCRRDVLHGYAGVGAEFLGLFEGAIPSIGVVAGLCCRNYSRR